MCLPPLSAAGSANCCSVPISDAGTDAQICGPSYVLQAVPSYGLGTWTVIPPSGGSAGIANNHDANSLVNINGAYGDYMFIWSEDNGTNCEDADTVIITFIEQPVANAGTNHSLCGTSVNLLQLLHQH